MVKIAFHDYARTNYRDHRLSRFQHQPRTSINPADLASTRALLAPQREAWKRRGHQLFSLLLHFPGPWDCSGGGNPQGVAPHSGQRAQLNPLPEGSSGSGPGAAARSPPQRLTRLPSIRHGSRFVYCCWISLNPDRCPNLRGWRNAGAGLAAQEGAARLPVAPSGRGGSEFGSCQPKVLGEIRDVCKFILFYSTAVLKISSPLLLS